MRLIDCLDERVEENLWVAGKMTRFTHETPDSRVKSVGHITVGGSGSQTQKGHYVQVGDSPGWWIVSRVVGPKVMIFREEKIECTREIRETDISRRKQRKLQVISIMGPSRATVAWSKDVGGIGNVLIWDERGDLNQGVRALSMTEVAKLIGFDGREVEILSRWHKEKPQDTEFLIGSTTPRSLAIAILMRAKTRLSMWYHQKRKTPQSNQTEMRAAGGSRRPEVNQQYGGRSTKDLGEVLVQSGIEVPSRSTYKHAFKGWEGWRIMRGLPVFCSQLEVDQKKEEQNIVEYVAEMGLKENISFATIRVTLFAMRRFHVENGLKDPLENKIRVQLAMEGLQKLQGGPMRKVPASMPLLRGLAEKLDQSIWDDLVTITAIMTMFLFGLRSGEALRSKREPDQEKCLRASMVVFRRNQEVVSGDAIEHADEIVLVMGRSKADTQGQGSVSNLQIKGF
jgi:hypothetical protein